MVNDLSSLSIVNDDGFRNLVKLLEPSFSIPSRTTIAKLVRARREKAKKKLIGRLKDAKAVSLTTDAWTSKAVMSYMT